MKRQPGVGYATVSDLEAHPWARRMSMRAAVLSCRMGDMRVMLRKTKGQGGWGTLYVLQQLDADGKPLPHFKVGMTARTPSRRCRDVASQTRAVWVVRGQWRSRFAPKVEQMVHAQLRPFRAFNDARREWYNCQDVRIIATAVEDMIAASQYLYLDYNNVEHALAGCNLRCPDPAPLFRTGLLLPTQCFYAWPSSFSSRSFSSRSGGARASL